ncbi:MAG: S41 family peptidase [Spirochaetia bacterium]|nr:S41 family peptidase [Spirochaetia bacterium]
MEMNEKQRSRLAGIVLSIILIIVGTWGQIQGKSTKNDITEPEYISLYNTILQHIKADYVEPVDSKELWLGAIKGMLAATNDEHTMYLDKDEFSDLETATKGDFGGLGIEIAMRDSILTVVTPMIDTPAMRAGLKPGDKIVEIEGKSTKDLSLRDAVNMLRGVPGTAVNISIAREGEEDLIKLDIVREIIKITIVESGIIEKHNIGYIKLKQFAGPAPMDMANAIRDLEEKKVKGLILDLRWNPGGLLTAAVDIANFFIKDGIIVSARGRHKELDKIEYADPRKAIAGDLPLVILVNEGSASASEIVTGAIKDHKRGIIVGTKTFGKGSVQSVIRLDYNTGLKMTIQKYYTPSGESIHKKGIMPNVVVKPYEFTKEERRHFRDLSDAKVLGTFVKENKEYNEESVKKFKKLLNDKGLALSDYASRYVLKQEIHNIGKRPLYDLELDTQLIKAIEQVK